MLFTSFVGWWYGLGWKGQLQKVERSLAKLTDQFSILELITTLFSPFRQIDAGRVQGSVSLDVRYHMWLSRLFSRVFGAIVRFFTIIAGIVVLFLAAIFGFLRISVWPLVPLLPLVGLLLGLTGWLPWK